MTRDDVRSARSARLKSVAGQRWTSHQLLITLITQAKSTRNTNNNNNNNNNND